MVRGEDQETEVDASSRAVSRVRLAPMRRKAPRMSIRFNDFREGCGRSVMGLAWCGKSLGSKEAYSAMATAPAGRLHRMSIWGHEVKGFTAYFKKKIHLQVVLTVMAPPTMGPRRLANATSAEIMDPYLAYFSLGINSKKTTMEIEKQPAAPIP